MHSTLIPYKKHKMLYQKCESIVLDSRGYFLLFSAVVLEVTRSFLVEKGILVEILSAMKEDVMRIFFLI